MLDDLLRDGHGEDVQVRAQQPVDPDPRRGIHERPLRDRADAQDGGDQLGDRDRSDRTDRERLDRTADLLGLRRTGRFHLWGVEVEGRKADHCDAVHDEEGREQDRGLLEAGSRCGQRQGAGVVTTRAHVRFVVTEYGIADLYGKSLRERARALIDIAHPNHRESLEKTAREQLGLRL